MRIVQAEIEASKGKFSVKHKPQIVGEDDSIALEDEDSGSSSDSINESSSASGGE